MSNILLNSERLILKPLSFTELSKIDNGELKDFDVFLEPEAISDSIKSAISKKLTKMKSQSEEVHEWYTYWLIINKQNQNGIGFIGFKGLPDEKGFTEVGYGISPDYRRKGLMTEALQTLIKWAEESENCRGITASRVLKTNTGSNMVLNNCRFKLAHSSEQENFYLLKF